MTSLKIPKTSNFNYVRITVLFFVALLACSEFYEYCANATCDRLGQNAWLILAIMQVWAVRMGSCGLAIRWTAGGASDPLSAGRNSAVFFPRAWSRPLNLGDLSGMLFYVRYELLPAPSCRTSS